MRIEILNPMFLHKYWSDIKPMLEKAMAHAHGEINIDQVKAYIASGKYALMLSLSDTNHIDGAVVFEYINYPNDLCFWIVAIGGKTTKESANLLFEYAKLNGATIVRGSAHKSVARLWEMKFGYKTIYYTVEKRL